MFTPADSTDYKSVSVSATLNVLPQQIPTGSSLVTLTSIRGAKVRPWDRPQGQEGDGGRAPVQRGPQPFHGPECRELLPPGRDDQEEVLGFKNSVALASAIYDPSAETVTLLPQGKRELPKYEQLTIRSGLLTDSLEYR